ncbi:MAG: MFS transporter, partial [Thaumarchaeota archaeon]|nr:MFS transporter [Nitrososphaerota archaeon]
MESSEASQGILERLETIPFGRFHVILLSLLFTAIAFDNMDQVTMSFVIPEYSKEWGLTPAITRIHPAMGIAGTLIGAIVGGIIADKVGRKRIFNAMVLIFAMTELANGFAPNFAFVVADCFVMGIGVGGAVSIAFSMISEFAPADKRGIMQILTGVISIGAGYIIASGLAYTAMPTLGWRFLFAIGVIPAFLIPFFQKYIPESPRYFLARGKVREAIQSVRMVESIARVDHVANLTLESSVPQREDKMGSAREVLSAKYRARTLLIWAYGGLWGFFNFSLLIWLPTALITKFGYTSSEAAFYTSIVDLVAIPVGFLTAFLYERTGRKPILTAYPIIGGIATILLGWLGGSGLLVPLTLVVLGIVVYSTGFALAGMFPPY